MLTIEEAVHGPDHPDVASTLDNLGIVQQLGEPGAAEDCVRRALAIFEARLPAAHPHTAIAPQLANLVRARGEVLLTIRDDDQPGPAPTAPSEPQRVTWSAYQPRQKHRRRT